jgi:hypothetical protein
MTAKATPTTETRPRGTVKWVNGDIVVSAPTLREMLALREEANKAFDKRYGTRRDE